MRIAVTLLARSAPDPARLAELAAQGDVELILACVDGGSTPLATVRPVARHVDGPVALLHASLLLARAEPLLALDAEDELPSPAVLRALAAHPSRGNALLLERDPLRALPGRYRRGCLAALRRALLDGERDLLSVARSLHATIVDERSLAAGHHLG